MKVSRPAAVLTAAILLAAFLTGCVAIKPPADTERVDFDAVSITGEHIAMKTLSDKKVVMINFFETWCSPCMGELPDIERLYEKYAGDGFVVIGVYSSSDEADVKAAAERLGITYPIIPVTDSLKSHQTQYVPTTIFVSGTGELLSGSPFVGAKSEAGWEKLIKGYLGK